MNNSQTNLDRLAAQHAQEIIRRAVEEKNAESDKIDNTVTKALGVLQENGVYACFLYLLAKEGDIGKVVVDELLNLLQGLGFKWNKPMKNGRPDLGAETVLKHINEKVTADLERLLLAKETLEQMLIYARYGAKARD